MEKEDLLRRLEQETKVFQNKAIQEAFLAIDRKDFVREDYEFEAYEDYAIPTLDGQTISQPTTVAFMLELLDPQKGDVILDIGSGTGWTTALLGHMIGEEGKVIGLEINPALVALSKENLKKYKDTDIESVVEILQAERETGYYRGAPFNKILVNASFADREPIAELLVQLAPGGTMVAPVLDSLIKFEKPEDLDEEYFETEYPGFSFVPYIG